MPLAMGRYYAEVEERGLFAQAIVDTQYDVMVPRDMERSFGEFTSFPKRFEVDDWNMANIQE